MTTPGVRSIIRGLAVLLGAFLLFLALDRFDELRYHDHLPGSPMHLLPGLWNAVIVAFGYIAYAGLRLWAGVEILRWKRLWAVAAGIVSVIFAVNVAGYQEAHNLMNSPLIPHYAISLVQRPFLIKGLLLVIGIGASFGFRYRSNYRAAFAILCGLVTMNFVFEPLYWALTPH